MAGKSDSGAAQSKQASQPTDRPQPAQPKTIVLFSDGTGNSSAKLFKTNVWRLYEALDLAPPERDSDRLQVAYYDNGVGTSNFRPLRLLGGIFGFGLKAGVLRLYRYLCRNYRAGDTIYVFGFSRGAFTIRLLVGLIASQGLVRCDDDGDLHIQAKAAYRELCRNVWPNKRPARDLVGDLRKIRDKLVAWKRRAFDQRSYASVERCHPDIQFVGVWDTVAAYGGPFAEITRGIDDWVWPLTMPNYALSTKVLRAAHALALDDERDAFMPLLWDEVREAELVREGEIVWEDADRGPVRQRRHPAEGRLNQVWFSGVHSDVGGGYPDESLSFVSLLWMMDEATRDTPKPERLRFIRPIVERAEKFANPYGPIHDSRAGFGAYYRYQPRKIAAWQQPVDHRTFALRDPESPGRDAEWKRCPDRGLLTDVKVHESVIARIVSGTDRYAPIAIPDRFTVARTASNGFAQPYFPPATQIPTGDPAAQARRAALTESAWDRVWSRRKIYYLTVLLSLALLVFPLLAGPNPLDDLCSDDRCFAARPIRWIGEFLPSALSPWASSFARHPIIFFALVVVIGMLLARGKALEGSVHDRSWRLWNEARSVEPSADQLALGRLHRIRTSRLYQNSLHRLRWTVLPLITGMLTWVLLVMLAGAVVTQLYLIIDETRAGACARPVPAKPGGAVLMRTSDLCTNLAASVEMEKTYLLTVQVDEPWKDFGPTGRKGYEAQPDTPPDLPLRVDIPGQPFRRVISARWFEPALRIRWDGRVFRRGVHIFRPTLKPIPEMPHCYGAEFKAKRDGELDIFVNDARLPFDRGLFYKRNQGTALVSVKPGVDDGTGKSYDCVRTP